MRGRGDCLGGENWVFPEEEEEEEEAVVMVKCKKKKKIGEDVV